MSTRLRRLPLLVGAAVLALVLAGCGEDGAFGITVVAGGEHRVSGDRPGSLMVAGGTAVVTEDARVRGSVWVLSGSLKLAGAVDEDLVLVGGDARLEAGAAVGGDVALAGGSASGLGRAQIAGTVTERAGTNLPLTPGWESEQPIAVRIAVRALGAVLAGVLALAFALLVPRPLERIATAVRDQPHVSLALGLLAVIVALPLAVFMAFTIVLIPIALVFLLLLALAAAYGWAATGTLLLRRLVPPTRGLSLPAAAALGATALTVVAATAEVVPLLGLVLVAALISTAFGAVLLTRLGTRAPARDPSEAR